MPPTGVSRSRRLVCLTGFMGSGKTTVGRHLARQIGWRFVDLDERIEARAGLDIPSIFERLGEPAFRQLEFEVLARALGEAVEQDRPTVLALGGGTFAQPENVALLRGNGPDSSAKNRSGTIVIWLDCAMEHLLLRCATMTNRPVFRDEVSFRQLYEQRLPYYRQADHRIESNGEPRQVVERILALGILEGVVT